MFPASLNSSRYRLGGYTRWLLDFKADRFNLIAWIDFHLLDIVYSDLCAEALAFACSSVWLVVLLRRISCNIGYRCRGSLIFVSSPSLNV
jgi:hypothetical protein